MTESTNDQAFQFCAEISKANGEKPIGSAGSADVWLFVEVAPPWPRDVWEAKTVPPALLAAGFDGLSGSLGHVISYDCSFNDQS